MSNLWDLSHIQPRHDVVVPGDTMSAVFWNAVAQRGDTVFMRQKHLGL
jgi:long-chain acyl-CoA synthetase